MPLPVAFDDDFFESSCQSERSTSQIRLVQSPVRVPDFSRKGIKLRGQESRQQLSRFDANYSALFRFTSYLAAACIHDPRRIKVGHTIRAFGARAVPDPQIIESGVRE